MIPSVARRSGPVAITLASQTDFAGWRDAARSLVLDDVDPADIAWRVADDGAGDLFDASSSASSLPQRSPASSSPSRRPSPPPPLLEGEGDSETSTPPSPLRGGVRGGGTAEHDAGKARAPVPGHRFTVPRAFIERAEAVACHRDSARFAFLYRLLHRLARQPDLMKIASDPDIRRFEAMEKAVRRDMHKMRAFVRFRQVGEGETARYVAWFEPDHFIVERNAAFFVRRFTGMRWTILTPDASADWDGERLAIGPGARKADAPGADATDDLWRTYFASIFNPARLKVKAMQAEMPKKYWRNLPEASLIPALIAGAERSARAMIDRMPTMPAPHHDTVRRRHWPDAPSETQPQTPPETPKDGADATTLAQLREAASGCRRCPLWRDATQTVFGEGPGDARVIFVGEQPGDQEDIAGRPFVGPAGRLFDAVVEEAGIDRSVTYVTNAVKHFKFEPRGKRRIHQKPNAGEVQACRWWVDRELALIRPDLVVALGATAAQSLLGKPVPITRMRGQTVTREDGLKVFLTVHPSYLLRLPDDAKDAERARFTADMRAVKRLIGAG